MKITIDVDPEIIEDIWTHSYAQSTRNYDTVIDAVCREYNNRKPEPFKPLGSICPFGIVESSNDGEYSLNNLHPQIDPTQKERMYIGKLDNLIMFRDYLTNYINWAKLQRD